MEEKTFTISYMEDVESYIIETGNNAPKSKLREIGAKSLSPIAEVLSLKKRTKEFSSERLSSRMWNTFIP